MPAEGIHFSALDDSRFETKHPGAMRLGALFVDLPYFERFAFAVLRYLFKRGPAPSPWGDVTHTKAPITVGRLLIEEAVRIRNDRLYAMALGYISHCAVDRTVHPFVNALARARAERFGDTLQRQHQEVEKYQSIIFHDARVGFEIMGTDTLRAHCKVDDDVLRDARASDALGRVLTRAWGQAPGTKSWPGWLASYREYIALIASPLGKRIAPRDEKERVRAELFTGFPAQFDAAVACSKQWMQTLDAYGKDGRFDDSARAELERIIPEGTIDPG